MAEEIEKIEKIAKLGKNTPASKVSGIEEAIDRVSPNKDHFESLMSQSKTIPVEAVVKAPLIEPVQKSNIFDEVRKLNQNVDQVTKATPKDLANKAEGLIGQIEDIKDKLRTPDLELKGSYQTLLKNKLTHIDENLRIALTKAGVEYKVPEKEVVSKNPIERFLGFLTDGQHQLQNLSSDLSGVAAQKGNLSPASMLAIQVKVTFITQELEFFTSVLNKALESTKTIMNVQV